MPNPKAPSAAQAVLAKAGLDRLASPPAGIVQKPRKIHGTEYVGETGRDPRLAELPGGDIVVASKDRPPQIIRQQTPMERIMAKAVELPPDTSHVALCTVSWPSGRKGQSVVAVRGDGADPMVWDYNSGRWVIFRLNAHGIIMP